jgi:Replication-relaxation
MKASDRPSGRVEPARLYPAHFSPDDNGSLNPVASFARTARPATAAYVASLPARLSSRDLAIVRDLGRVRCLTGRQLERLHFHDLAAPNRDRARRRVLNRLISLSVITTLERLIGGVRAGSAGLVYTLDSAGQRLLRLLNGEGRESARRPWTPGALFLNHTLDVAELYVQLREAERTGQLELSRFLAEPACWQRTASLGTLKPDAYALVASGEVEDAWWLEVDRGTESPGTLQRKLRLYLLAAQAGITGPDQILPRVLVTVPNERRLAIVLRITDSLGANAQRLISVSLHERAVPFMVEVLQE